MIPVKPLVGLLMETVLLAPFAAVMIVVWNVDGSGNSKTPGEFVIEKAFVRR